MTVCEPRPTVIKIAPMLCSLSLMIALLMVCNILGHQIEWACIGQNAMPLAQVACFCALSALTLGAHAQLTASARKLKSWPTSDYLIHGESPEARIGSPIVALNGAIYLFGGATALGECCASVSA